MKKLISAIVVQTILSSTLSMVAEARVHVDGYYRHNGTYVAPHYRTDPDSSFNNNWSTKGNINPYTGKYGTKTHPSSSSYDSYSSSSSSYSNSSDETEASSDSSSELSED